MLFLAKHSGYFDAEIEPIELKAKKGTQLFDTDEHPRECSLESLAQLKPTFKKGGLVTAGTASVGLFRKKFKRLNITKNPLCIMFGSTLISNLSKLFI